jgi:hypothetical protein
MKIMYDTYRNKTISSYVFVSDFKKSDLFMIADAGYLTKLLVGAHTDTIICSNPVNMARCERGMNTSG